MNKLFQAIEAKDAEEIEIYLKAFITSNPADTNNTIKQALQKIESMNISLWEKHDGAEFKTNRQEWIEDYFVDLQVDLRMNFSKERYMHMLEVGKIAFPTKLGQSKTTTQSMKNKNPNNNTLKDGTEPKKGQTLLYMGVAGVAVVVLAVVLVKIIKNG